MLNLARVGPWRPAIVQRFMVGLSILALLNGCHKVGPERYPVRGTVKINGSTAERVIVQFHFVGNQPPQGNDRYPSALTDASGAFELGKGSETAGAIPGEYAVTFSLMSGPELGAFDKLKGRFADPSKSKFAVKVPEDTKQPLTFELVDPNLK